MHATIENNNELNISTIYKIFIEYSYLQWHGNIIAVKPWK